MLKTLAITALCIIFLSCQKFEDFKTSDEVSGQAGYSIKSFVALNQLDNIYLSSPKSVKQISDVFVNKEYLFIAEFGKGIHIFKNPDSERPSPLHFLNIPALQKFTVKDDHIVCNNGNDIIAFRISGLSAIEKNPAKRDSIVNDIRNFGIINRQSNIYSFPNYPTQRNIYFECPDTLGFVIEWQNIAQNKPLNCYR